MVTLDSPLRTGRVISHIPALLVMSLNDAGKVPQIPHAPTAGGLGWRMPTLADMESVQWLASWSGPRVDSQGFRPLAGLASYKDYWRSHDASDVRELCSLRGSPRAVVELTKWLRDDAESHERKLVGYFEHLDLGLAQVMARLGGRPSNLRGWEYSCQD